jgi:hypothetical protein
MSIDERLKEAREASEAASWEASRAVSGVAYWAASEAASREASWVAFETSYWASRYKECSYEIQVAILRGLLND